METNPRDVTHLLHEIKDGNHEAHNRLINLLYGELRRTAAGAGARANDTLCPTALVHDAYYRLMESKASFKDRFHFLASISVVMRNMVIDYAREKKAQKRGGDVQRVALIDDECGTDEDPTLERLAEALDLLEQINPRQAKVLQLKYFGGLTLQEMSRGLELSLGTVHNDLKAAKTWLTWQLKDGQ